MFLFIITNNNNSEGLEVVPVP